MCKMTAIILVSFSVLMFFAGCDTGSGSSSSSTSYRVTYDGNGYLSGTVPVDGNSYKSGSTVTVLDNSGSLAKAEYTFEGWNSESDGSGTAVIAGNQFSISGNVTLYAQWEIDPSSTSIIDTKTFRAANTSTNQFYDCEADQYIEGTYCKVYIERTSSVSIATAQAIADEFDDNIYTQIRSAFGTESDIDGNNKVILLYLDIQDNYAITGTGGYTSGYFHPINEFDTSTYSDSNEAEILYMDTDPADPTTESSYLTIAHEFQHLINFSATYYFDDGTTQDTWINEGLSSGAEYVYSGEINSSRVSFFNNDPEDTILYGNNFFVWDGYWEANTQYGLLANYSTVNLFFQWLRIHSANGVGIYKDILDSGDRDVNAVTAAAGTDISAEFGSWPTLLSTWMIANQLCLNSGYKGYNNVISLSARKFSSSNNYSWYFSPGEGIFSTMPGGGNIPPPAAGSISSTWG